MASLLFLIFFLGGGNFCVDQQKIQREMEAALAEDATVYQYDEVSPGLLPISCRILKRERTKATSTAFIFACFRSTTR